MAINIFANAEAEGPKPASDIVGRFRSGRQLQGRPMSLSTWRVTSGDPDVLAFLAATYGAVEGPQEWETKTEERLEVILKADSIPIILSGPHAVRSEMVLWGRKGKVRSCDGLVQQGEGAQGKPCECPHAMEDKIEGAKAGTACEPSISYLFHLAEAPDLGRFRFQTGSWSVARAVSDTEVALASIEGPALGRLYLEQRTRKSDSVAYTVSVLDIEGPAPAEDGVS
jgi:hypothetical protein